jgi:indolepyruvate ferredoxin oxidoreductase beta subunit
MSQRGGAVQSYLRLSDNPIYSDLIPLGKADLILSVEPMESLRYLPYLSPEGYVVTNTTTYKNILNYPEYEVITDQIKMLPRAISLDAEKIAKEMGNSKASNMVMLGAATPFIDIPLSSLENGIREIFGRKGEAIVELNLKALHAGREFAEANR